MASGRRVKKEDQQSENRTNREYDHQPETSSLSTVRDHEQQPDYSSENGTKH